MSRYISIDDLQSYCDNKRDHSITPNEFQRMDSICIVRCKDCKYGSQHNGGIMCMKNYCDGGDEIHIAEWFCADGEAKDGEAGMPDIDKVKQGIKACWSEHWCHKCCVCPYKPDRDNDDTCVERLGADTLELLKGQQAEIERLKAEKDEAYEKGFKDGQNNIIEAQAEGR